MSRLTAYGRPYTRVTMTASAAKHFNQLPMGSTDHHVAKPIIGLAAAGGQRQPSHTQATTPQGQQGQHIGQVRARRFDATDPTNAMTQAITSKTISGYTVIQLILSIIIRLSIQFDQFNLEMATCLQQLVPPTTSITSVKGLG